MGPLFSEEQSIVVSVKKAVALPTGKGLVEEIPCTFQIPKGEALSFFEYAPLHDLLDAAEGYELERVSIKFNLPESSRGPYVVKAWDYYENPKEQEVAHQAQPMVLEPVTLGSIRLSQHKSDDGLLLVDTTLSVPINSSEEAGEIDKCAGRKLVVSMQLKVIEIPEAAPEAQE